MRIGALVLGIIGGLGGFMGAIFVLFLGGIGSALGAEKAGQVVGLGWAAIPLALLGIIGGAMAIGKPTAAGIMMLVSGVGGFIAISAGYLFGGPLLIVGGILALAGRKKREKTQAQPAS